MRVRVERRWRRRRMEYMGKEGVVGSRRRGRRGRRGRWSAEADGVFGGGAADVVVGRCG